MERSLSSLAFRGSIAEAIAEAKSQKKLFVVYTASENPESKLLETSTWINPNVSEILSKYCILLHILEGSSEALNFSAIYPQHSAPCITAIGYNGVQLWQKEGFVSADVLASSLEKAWLSLHVQETTAAFLTAALASGKQLASGTSATASSEQVTPGTFVSTPLTDDHIPSLDAGQPLHSETIEDSSSYKEADSKQDGVALPEPSLADELDKSKLDKSISKTETGNTSQHPVEIGQNDTETDSKQDGVAFPEPSLADDLDNSKLDESISKTETGNTSEHPVEIGQNNPETECLVPGKKLNFCENHLGSSKEVSPKLVNAHINAVDVTEVEKADTSDSSAIESKDVFLNIRLPDGSSLRVKFSVMDTLKMVKDYINENKTSSLGSFSLAIPYPRKVFNDQDLHSTLSELGLFNRQALVVVPHNQNNSHYRGGSSHRQTDSLGDTSISNASEGYWASVRRILSYVNPFSYLSRSATSPSAAQESQSGIWQYSPNPSLQNTLRDGGRPSPVNPSEQSTTTSGRDSNNKIRQQTSRFGSNIHTLRHDEDDSRFNDRNAFWNGNSTQFGGNDDEK